MKDEKAPILLKFDVLPLPGEMARAIKKENGKFPTDEEMKAIVDVYCRTECPGLLQVLCNSTVTRGNVISGWLAGCPFCHLNRDRIAVSGKRVQTTES